MCRPTCMHSTKRVTALILVAGGTALLAACSGGTNSGPSSSMAGAAQAGGAQAHAPAAANEPEAGTSFGASNGLAANGSSASSKSAGSTTRITSAAIVYTAQLTVRVPYVPDATTQAAQIATTAGGYISNETAANGSGATASIELKIPVSVYPATLSKLAGLGIQVSLQQQAQDVTQQVADVSSQVASDQAAIVQLRALLSHAGSVGDLLSVQNQINSEESVLEGIEAQQRVLSSQTSYATVSLTILGPKHAAAPVHHKPSRPPNIAGGLAAGWRALRITFDWVTAFLGAVAPFTGTLAILAAVGYYARRRLLRRQAT
jgi:hypothetical protein